MGIAERVTGTVENWRTRWGQALNDFLVTILSFGLEVFMDVIGKAFAPKLAPLIDTLEKTGKVPPELAKILEELKTPKGEVAAVLGGAVGNSMIGGALGSMGDALFAGFAQAMNRLNPNVIPGLEQATRLRLRGEISPEDFKYVLLSLGIPEEEQSLYLGLAQIRLDPMSWIIALRREYEGWDKIKDDLAHQGWDENRIEALKFVTLYYPSPAELIHWTAREVFEPEMVDKYRLMAGADKLKRGLFYKAGMDDEQINNHWIAHWEHASWMQVIEMLHRGLIDEPDVKDWFPLVEMAPYWADHLIETAYTWPTRVDVRRWWDMRTIDEARLRELYSGMGYRGKNLDDYVLWTKVYVAFPDLMARWSKGWISLEEVRSELTGMGMPAERLEEFIQMKVKAEQPERTTKERDITKTDIIKGVKQGVITRGEGVELLVDMGYDEDEAVYILEINIPPDEEEVVVRQRELTKSDILKGLKTDVITRADAKTELLDLRYSPADAEFLLKIYDAQVKPPVTPREREASKADIILAVKKGLITPEDAYLMLQDIDFTAEAAAFILEVRAEVSPFSPINFAEFKNLTSKYRVAAGMEAKPMPEEIKKVAEEVVRLTGEVEALTRSIEEEKRGLVEEEVLPAETTERLKELQVTRNRAVAELTRVQSEYDRLVAEWKHRQQT